MLFSFILLFLFFWLHFVDINVACKLCISFDRKKKNEQVCEIHYSRGHIRTYQISGLKITIIKK